jgi:hypothetical protein
LGWEAGGQDEGRRTEVGTEEGIVRWGERRGMENSGYSTGGTRPHSCFPRAGLYPPLLARHDLVAAFHTVQRHLSVLAVALLSPLAARTIASG